MANEYAELADLKLSLGITADTWDDILGSILEAASRSIDDYCGRRFYLDETATARTFTAHSVWRVLVDDIATTEDLVVATDQIGAGSYDQTWTKDATTGAGFRLEPQNHPPYTSLVVSGTVGWPRRGAGVQVTAKWGWPAVPPAVVTACLQLASMMWRDLPASGPGAGGVTSIKLEGSDAVSYAAPAQLAAAAAGNLDLVHRFLDPYRRLPTP